MSFCIICTFRKLNPSQQINSEEQHPFSFDLTKELENLHKFSFNSFLTLLAVLTISGSKALLPVVLVLLIYTISLRLVVNACFLRNYPTLSRFLHAVPLLGTSCMAGVELFFDMQSPALAVIALLSSVLPLIVTLIHHGRQCTEPAMVVLPIRMQDPQATMSSSTDMTVETNSVSSVAEAGDSGVC